MIKKDTNMCYIYNDGDFATKYAGYNEDCPCLIVDNIPDMDTANKILCDIISRFSEYDKSGFYIIEDNTIVLDRLEDGESMEDIFTKTINMEYY